MRKITLTLAAAFLMWGSQGAETLLDVDAPGNPAMAIPGTRGRGSVAESFRLADRPVSNLEYCGFLNSLKPEAAKSHYQPDMGIRLAGGKYVPADGAAEKPVTMLSYIDAAAYCNYRSGGPVYRVIDSQVTARNTAAVDSPRVYYIPNRNEWLKGRFYRNGSWQAYSPSPQAEMVEDLAKAWHRAAIGKGKSPEDAIYINNYTTNSGGLSEDNIRRPDVTLRVAATPRFSLEESLNDRHNIYETADPALALSIRAESAADAKLSWKIFDYFGKEIASSSRQLKLKSGLNRVEIPSQTGKQEGYFRLCPELQADGKPVTVPEIPFVVASTQPFKPVPDADFGLSTHLDRMKYCWGRVLPEEYLPILKFMNVSFLRSDRPESSIDRAMREAGIRMLTFLPFHYTYDLYKTPPRTAEAEKWRKLGVPEELITYAMQCDRLMRNNPEITDWEIGNEPHAWKITAADYAQQAKAARIVADAQAHPVRLILGDMNFIHRSVIGEADGARGMDAVAIHCYGFFQDYPHGIPNRVLDLKRTMAERGQSKTPVWMTETSGCGYWTGIYPGSTQEEVRRYQALDLPKKLLGSRALGVDKVFFYQFADMVVDGNEGQFGLTDSRFFPKPAMIAYRTVSRLFEGSTFEGRIKLPEEFTGFCFRQEGTPCAVLWRNDKPKYLIRRSPGVQQPMVSIGAPQTVELPAEKPVELIDLMGNTSVLTPHDGKVSVPVSEYPVFLRGDFRPQLDRDYGKVRVEATELPAAKLQFLPTLPVLNGLISLHNMQMGIRMALKRETPQPIALRVHNLTDKPLEGTVSLISPINFDDGPWKIEPASVAVKIPANGTATANFTVTVGKLENVGTALYILKAKFDTGKETVFDEAMVSLEYKNGKPEIY